jgi:glucose/arabinose dehydrogenase
VKRAILAAGVAALFAMQASSGANAVGSTGADGIRVPSGYRISIVASGIPYASNLAFDSRGGLWVSSAANDLASEGWVWYVRKPGARAKQVIGPLSSALGLAWLHQRLYVSSVVPVSGETYAGRVTAYWGFTGTRFEHSRIVLDGIPVGEHSVDSLAVGPDNRLYLGVGSQMDREAPTARHSAAVISFRPTGSDVQVEASGLRNPYGLAFVPGTSQLLVSDEGVDFPGDRPPDELNSLDVSKAPPDFGFPLCYGQGGPACDGKVEALARLDPHSAAGGVAVSPNFGRLGPSAFVAEYGSSPGFGTHPTGAQIVRIPLPGDRVPASPKPTVFANGFNHPDPLGLAIGPDRSLYATLWESGEVVRVTPTSTPAPRTAGVTGRAVLFAWTLAQLWARALDTPPAFLISGVLEVVASHLVGATTRSASPR